MNFFAQFSSVAASALVAAVWQGAVLALVVWVVLRAVPSLSAAVRSFVWTAVFALMTALHFLPFVTGNPGSGSATALHAEPWVAAAIGAAWIALSLLRGGQLAWSALHLRRLLRQAVEVNVGAEIEPLLSAGGRRVALCASGDVARPSVLGFFHPRILVPSELIAALSRDELRQVVVHEMEHLHRHDDWRNLLQKLALVLFPLNPALALVERRLCAERELACDDRVLELGHGRKAYAMCLAHLAEYGLVRNGYALMLGAWERRPELVRRIERIISQPARSMGRGPSLALTAMLLAMVGGGGAALSRAPQLVSFSSQDRSAMVDFEKRGEALDRNAVLRAVGGGSAQVVNADVRQGTTAAAAPKIHRAVLKQRKKVQRPAAQLAELTMPSNAERGTRMVVLTEWHSTISEEGVSQTLVVRRFQTVEPTQVVRAVYLVPTAEGWLVVKI